MKTQKPTLIALVVALSLFGCAPVKPGADPVVVDAQRTTLLAMDAFDSIEQVDLDTYAAWKAIDAPSAAAFRTYVNYIRANKYNWLKSVRSLTTTYQNSRTADNKASLQTALNVLLEATKQANSYISKAHTALAQKH